MRVFYQKDELSSCSQKKGIQFSAKVLILAIFDYLGPPSKSISSTYRQNLKKSLVSFLGEVVRNFVLNFGLSLSAGLREGQPFCKSIFSKIRDFSLLQCCGAAICSLLCLFYCYSPFFLRTSFQSLVIWLFSIGYSLTNRRKAAIFDDFRLFWAFFGHFFLSSPK